MDFERATYFFAIVILTLIGLIWGMVDTRRVIEAPFLYATGMALILCPQFYVVAAGVVYVPDDAVRVFSIMVMLCSAALYLGYFREPRTPAHRTKSSAETWSIIPTSLYRLGLAAALAGAFGVYKLRALGTITEWRGWPVYWVTLAVFIVPGIILMLIAYMDAPRLVLLVPILFFTTFPMASVTESGRRSATLTLPLMYLMPIMLCKPNLRIPRWAIVSAFVLGFIVVYAFPTWRDSFKEHQYAQSIEDHPLTEVISDVFEGNRGKPLEISDGMVVTGARFRRGNYEWGTGVYNQLVQNFVPGGLIGRDVKDSLRFGVGVSHDWVTEVYGIPVASYTAKSGYEDLFSQFWFAGCIVVYWVGRVFRRVHDASEHMQDARAVIFLCFFISFPASIPYGPMLGIIVLQLPLIFLMLLAFRWCTVRRHSQSRMQIPRLMPATMRSGRIPVKQAS